MPAHNNPDPTVMDTPRSSRVVVSLSGPTGTGKSDLAIALAGVCNGIIINADSMQIYRDLCIITARPSPADMHTVPHALYGVLDGAEACNAARWIDLAVPVIRQAWEQGKLPILVGGTGMYLHALMHGIADIPEVPDAIRAEVREKMEMLGPEAFYKKFREDDPEMAAKLKPGDAQRMLRAAEVMYATGISLAEWQRQPSVSPLPEAHWHNFAATLPREVLYPHINARFERMLEAAAWEEVEALLARDLPRDLPIMRAHGVPELIAVLEGRMARADAIAKAQQNTRNYAKRQMTWIRHQLPDATILDMQCETSELVRSMQEKIQEMRVKTA